MSVEGERERAPRERKGPGRRAHAVIEGRAGAARITIQLRGRGERNLAAPSARTHKTRVPPRVGHASNSSARAHTRTSKRVSFSIKGEKESPAPQSLPHRAALPRNVFSPFRLFTEQNSSHRPKYREVQKRAEEEEEQKTPIN